MRLDREIRELEIPGVRTEAEFWRELQEADRDTQFKMLEKASSGTFVAALIKLFVSGGWELIDKFNELGFPDFGEELERGVR